MNERIKKIRKEEGITQEEFANRLKLSRNFITQLEAGTKMPSERTIDSICDVFNINIEWLRHGSGEMHRKRSRAQEIGDFASELMNDENDSFRSRFVAALSKLGANDWEVIEKFILELQKKEE